MSLSTTFQRLFRRKPDRFLFRLQEQSALVLCGTSALIEYMWVPNKKNAARVRVHEKKADDVRRALIVELNQTFVTPIDREDLFALSRAIDEILDYAYATIYEVDVLGVHPNTYVHEMVALLHAGASEINLAVCQLETEPHEANQHAVRAKRLVSQIEALYTQALAALFDSPTDLDDVIEMLKLREIYRHLFHAGQSIEQAADSISDIVMKFY